MKLITKNNASRIPDSHQSVKNADAIEKPRHIVRRTALQKTAHTAPTFRFWLGISIVGMVRSNENKLSHGSRERGFAANFYFLISHL
jgi:hypothetical protein